ncbi:MAG: hypothetical protein AB7K24_33810 [Gemmataceae bacterium]
MKTRANLERIENEEQRHEEQELYESTAGIDSDDAAPVAHVLIPTAGCLLLIGLAMACLGPAEGLATFLRGFQQVVLLICFPFSTGKELIARIYEVAATSPYLQALGIFAAKFAALNLFPSPVLNGGAILMALFNWGKPERTRQLEETLELLGVLFGLLWGGAVALAWYSYYSGFDPFG